MVGSCGASFSDDVHGVQSGSRSRLVRRGPRRPVSMSGLLSYVSNLVGVNVLGPDVLAPSSVGAACSILSVSLPCTPYINGLTYGVLLALKGR